MKLGEALAERARMQRKIGELRTRINANATKQEDTTEAEDPNALLMEVETTHQELATLIAQINLTNARTVLREKSLTYWLAERDRLAGLVNTLTQAAQAAQSGPDEMRYMRSELKLDRNVDVKNLREKADGLSASLRTLDNEIQALNWVTECV